MSTPNEHVHPVLRAAVNAVAPSVPAKVEQPPAPVPNTCSLLVDDRAPIVRIIEALASGGFAVVNSNGHLVITDRPADFRSSHRGQRT